LRLSLSNGRTLRTRKRGSLGKIQEIFSNIEKKINKKLKIIQNIIKIKILL